MSTPTQPSQVAHMRLDFKVVSKGQGDLVNLICQLLSLCSDEFDTFPKDNGVVCRFERAGCILHLNQTGDATGVAVQLLSDSECVLMHCVLIQKLLDYLISDSTTLVLIIRASALLPSFPCGCQHQSLTPVHRVVNSLQCSNHKGRSLAGASRLPGQHHKQHHTTLETHST